MSSRPAGKPAGFFLSSFAELNRRTDPPTGTAFCALSGASRLNPGSGYLAKCEARHIRLRGLALSMMPVGALSSIEDGTNENASENILVVQVRRLRAISREILELAIRRLHDESVGRWSHAVDRATIVSCPFLGAGFLRLADEFPAIGRSAAQGIASLPRQIGQASGHG